MVVKSKVRNTIYFQWGFFFFLLVFFLWMFVVCVSAVWSYYSERSVNDTDAPLWAIVLGIYSLFVVFLIVHLLRTVASVTINGYDIGLRYLFLPIFAFHYDMRDFDFYVIDKQNRNGDTWQDLLLVRNDRIIIRITEKNFKNFRDIKMGMKMKCVGKLRLRFFDGLREMLHMRIRFDKYKLLK